MFKRIYIEITDYCNLNCKFCKTKKNTAMMSFDDFKIVFDKVAYNTSEIVLHVSGEPLMHKDLGLIVDYIKANNKRVMITTNGFLLKNYIDASKINISLHSTYFLDDDKLKSYLDNIYNFIKMSHEINEYIVFNLRLWVDTSSHRVKVEKYLEKLYDKQINHENIRLDKRVILCYDEEFMWPSLDNSYVGDIGCCHGGKSHLAILNDGCVSICCLDSLANSNLGNIFKSDLRSILNSEKYLSTIKGFNDNKLMLDICKHCTYHKRFMK